MAFKCGRNQFSEKRLFLYINNALKRFNEAWNEENEMATTMCMYINKYKHIFSVYDKY